MSEEWTQALFQDPLQDALSSFLALIFIAFASAGSIGGGGLLVPLFLLVSHLGRSAIPLSKAAICGGAIANLFLRWPLRHPTADRPLIAFEVAIILEPMTLVGSVIGVTLNTICPQWLITVLLVLLLGHTGLKTLKKAQTIWSAEGAARERAKASMQAPLLETKVDGMPAQRPSHDSELTIKQQESERIVERERHAQPWMLCVLCGSTFIMFFTMMLRGGHGAAPLLFPVPCGLWLFWLLPIGGCCILTVTTVAVGQYLSAMHREKLSVLYKFEEGDVQWEGRNISLLPFVCTLAGVAAGLLGVGGAMIKGPLMLEMGILPSVASATATFMILFTSASTTVQFLIGGLLRWDYALWFGAVGALGAFLGQSAVTALVKRYQRQSILVFALGVNIVTSTIVMAAVGGTSIATDLVEGEWERFRFRSICA